VTSAVYPGSLQPYQLYADDAIYQLERLARWLQAQLELHGRLHILRMVGSSGKSGSELPQFLYSYFDVEKIPPGQASRWMTAVSKPDLGSDEAVHHAALLEYSSLSTAFGVPPSLTERLFVHERSRLSSPVQRVVAYPNTWKWHFWDRREDVFDQAGDRTQTGKFDALYALIQAHAVEGEAGGVEMTFVPVFERSTGAERHGALLGWIFGNDLFSDDQKRVEDGLHHYLPLVADRLVALTDDDLLKVPGLDATGIARQQAILNFPGWQQIDVVDSGTDRPSYSGGALVPIGPRWFNVESQSHWGQLAPPRGKALRIEMGRYFRPPPAELEEDYACWVAQRVRRLHRLLWLNEQRDLFASQAHEGRAFRVIQQDIAELDAALTQAKHSLQSVRAAVYPSWDALSRMAEDFWPLFDEGRPIVLPDGTLFHAKHTLTGSDEEERRCRAGLAWIVHTILGTQPVNRLDYTLSALRVMQTATEYQRMVLQDLAFLLTEGELEPRACEDVMSDIFEPAPDRYKAVRAMKAIKEVLFTSMKVARPPLVLSDLLLKASIRGPEGSLVGNCSTLNAPFTPGSVAQFVNTMAWATKGEFRKGSVVRVKSQRNEVVSIGVEWEAPQGISWNNLRNLKTRTAPGELSTAHGSHERPIRLMTRGWESGCGARGETDQDAECFGRRDDWHLHATFRGDQQVFELISTPTSPARTE